MGVMRGNNRAFFERFFRAFLDRNRPENKEV